MVLIEPHYFRPAEVGTLLGDLTKSREQLGWIPNTTLKDLGAEMVPTNGQESAN